MSDDNKMKNSEPDKEKLNEEKTDEEMGNEKELDEEDLGEVSGGTDWQPSFKPGWLV